MTIDFIIGTILVIGTLASGAMAIRAMRRELQSIGTYTVTTTEPAPPPPPFDPSNPPPPYCWKEFDPMELEGGKPSPKVYETKTLPNGIGIYVPPDSTRNLEITLENGDSVFLDRRLFL